MNRPFSLFFLFLIFIPLIHADVSVDFECREDSCSYASGEDINLDVYLTSTVPSSIIRAYNIIVLSDDSAASKFTFVEGAEQLVSLDAFFSQSFINNAPYSKYLVGTNYYGWRMYDVKDAENSLTMARTRIGSITGRALAAGTVQLDLIADTDQSDDRDNYFLESGGRFPVYHSYTSKPLAITIDGDSSPPPDGGCSNDAECTAPSQCVSGQCKNVDTIITQIAAILRNNTLSTIQKVSGIARVLRDGLT